MPSLCGAWLPASHFSSSAWSAMPSCQDGGTLRCQGTSICSLFLWRQNSRTQGGEHNLVLSWASNLSLRFFVALTRCPQVIKQWNRRSLDRLFGTCGSFLPSLLDLQPILDRRGSRKHLTRTRASPIVAKPVATFCSPSSNDAVPDFRIGRTGQMVRHHSPLRIPYHQLI